MPPRTRGSARWTFPPSPRPLPAPLPDLSRTSPAIDTRGPRMPGDVVSTRPNPPRIDTRELRMPGDEVSNRPNLPAIDTRGRGMPGDEVSTRPNLPQSIPEAHVCRVMKYRIGGMRGERDLEGQGGAGEGLGMGRGRWCQGWRRAFSAPPATPSDTPSTSTRPTLIRSGSGSTSRVEWDKSIGRVSKRCLPTRPSSGSGTG